MTSDRLQPTVTVQPVNTIMEPRGSVQSTAMPDPVRRHLPNALTILRLFLAGGFFALLNSFRYPDHNSWCAYLSIAMFILAAVTDILDGHLARKWHVESVFGRVMDPFCDKVLIIGAFIYLAGPRFLVPQWVQADDFFNMATGVYPWMVVVILARELLVTSIRGEVEASGHSFAAKLPGKLKMILQSAVVPIVIFLVVQFKTDQTPWAKWTCYALVYATVVVTLWSGVPYIAGARRALAASRGAES